MMSTFNLWPVGQGLFYSGEVALGRDKCFRFVYDCGGDKKIIKKVVDTYVSTYYPKVSEDQKPELDMLVISHFDEDHINGLPCLLDKVRVKKLFIPYYDLESYLLFIIYVLIEDIDLSATELYLVPESGESSGERDDEEFRGEEFSLGNYSLTGLRVKKLISLSVSYQSYWRFKFYNAPAKKSCTEIKDRIDVLIGSQSLEDWFKGDESATKKEKEKKQKEKKQELRKIYAGCVASYLKNSRSNQSSLCLYHSPLSAEAVLGLHQHLVAKDFAPWLCLSSCSCLFSCPCLSSRLCSGRRLGTLLTGDLSLKASKWNSKYNYFKAYFEQEKDETAVFLLPHHGSKHNWSKDLIGDFKRPLFINSSGLGHRLGHPHLEVVTDIYQGNCSLVGSNQTCHLIYGIWL